MNIKTVTKRDGSKQPFEPDKLNKWAEWASAVGVDWSLIALEAAKKCNDGCTTEDLQNAMIDACKDMETNPYLKMAGKLYMGHMYKKIFGDHDTIPTLENMFDSMVAAGLWDDMDYSDEELEILDAAMDHSRDLRASYSECKQIMDKYAVMDRVSGRHYETPQFVYMRMAMGNMERMPRDRRIRDVIKLYNFLSNKKINAPTPFCLNLGTPSRQFASCCVTTTNDTAESLAAADHIAYMMTCASAGQGAHIKTRSLGNKVRKGQIKHMGKLPYYRASQAMVGANLQNSRGGALTMHFNVLDPEIDDLLALKHPQTIAEKRIKDIDYSFGANELFAEKVANNGTWRLVSYGDNPELYEAMYSGDQTKFRELYEEVERLNQGKEVSARALVKKALVQSYEVGRIYEHFTDELNRHTPFLDKIYSSNLCQEIALATKGYNSVAELYKEEEGTGEIGLCNIAAIVAGNTRDSEYEEVAYYTLLMTDNVMDIMDYPFPQLKYTATRRRSVAIGIMNLAHDLASRGLKYSSIEGKRYMHRLAETHSFFLHKASLRLAKEKGLAGWMHKTKYPLGWLPIDTMNKVVDVGQPLMRDWETLRQEIVAFGGIRNSVLEGYMPGESSSVASGCTNSIYPIRAYKVVKTSGTNKTLFIAPDLEFLQNDYELAWEIPTKDIIDMYSIFQKFCGQTISADIYQKFSGQKISMKKLIAEYLYRKKVGLKTRYYVNSSTSDNYGTMQSYDVGCGSGACTL